MGAVKQGIVTSSPAVGTLGSCLAASLVVTPVVLRTSVRRFGAVGARWKGFVALGLVAMAIGVVLFGKAQRVRETALGALVMLVGMAILALTGWGRRGQRGPESRRRAFCAAVAPGYSRMSRWSAVRASRRCPSAR